ncbi:MAG: FAD-dependent monooxygenase [Actinomycetota bacterium]
MVDELEVAVVGGSLGGLTAACLLRDAGHRVTVYERSPVPLEERGAGIGLLSATYRYLVERAGVALDEVSVATDAIRYLDADGAVIDDTAHRYLFSSWNTVYRALMGHWERPGAEAGRYRLDHEMTAFRVDDDGRVQVEFANGARVGCDLLIGADGVGSQARAALLPAVEPAYAGYVAWRGMVPERDLAADTAGLLGDAITYFVYPGSHILAYPIPSAEGSVAPGDRLVNIVWYRNYTAGDELTDLLTDADGVVRTMSVPPGSMAPRHCQEARATATSVLPAPLAEVVTTAEELFVQVVYDIEVDRMAFGPVCLLGDAAFAVRPHAAAGTAKAADDGWTLVEALAAEDSLAAATARWEASQLDLGRRLLARTRAIGHRSQVANDWRIGDPDLIFGLHRPGD